jgi:RNA polymerase sigma-70 factor (ECF subfamily)
VDPTAQARLEERLTTLCARSDYRGAAAEAVRAYGPEIYGFLRAVLASEDDAAEAFSEFAEALWRGLPSFRWDSTARTWAYAIARNVSRARQRDLARRRARLEDADSAFIEGVAQNVRTETLSFLRTEKRSRLEALRDALPPEDRMLLVLRVDRALEWKDLARVFAEDHGREQDEGHLAREAARLRKRFQLVKERLREMARAEGLLE